MFGPRHSENLYLIHNITAFADCANYKYFATNTHNTFVVSY